MTRAKDISKIITDADFSGTLDVTGTVTAGGLTVGASSNVVADITTGGTTPFFKVSRGTVSQTNLVASFHNNDGAGIDVHGNGDISFYEDTGTTPKLFWDASTERLGIGTSSPASLLDIRSSDPTLLVRGTSGSGVHNAEINFANSVGTVVGELGVHYIGGATNFYRNVPASWNHVWKVNDSEKLRINSSGNVGIGDSSPSQKLNVAGNVMLEGGDQFLYLTNVGTGNSGIYVRGNTAGSYLRSHSTGIHTWEVTGSEKMRINSTGDLLVSKTTSGLATEGIELRNNDEVYMTQDNGPPLRINRLSTDGALVVFYQGTIEEGTIEVSGSSVTLAGGHLSRWSQLADNTRDNTIVKGTVMTNLDQMAEWTTDGITEDNDQLNCTAVSTVEGDPNVAGVFLKWDDDDEVYTNDMFISMTGDMVIRIAQGTTVARGDLLMSAGDGTAKPQGDDIVRSKTIAKVTSTNVSHTYDDGTYLVPCVLMAC